MGRLFVFIFHVCTIIYMRIHDTNTPDMIDLPVVEESQPFAMLAAAVDPAHRWAGQEVPLHPACLGVRDILLEMKMTTTKTRKVSRERTGILVESEGTLCYAFV